MNHYDTCRVKCEALIRTVPVVALLWLLPVQSWAVSGTVRLENGDMLEGEIRLPPDDEIKLVLANSKENAIVPIEDIERIDVAARPEVPDKLPFFKRLWRRFWGPPDTKQTLTVTLRNGEQYEGWFSWHQSEGLLEVRTSKYVVQKAYLKPKQTDRERHQPVDITRRYVRSIVFSKAAAPVRKECPKCARSFEQPEYKYCPLDGTALTEPVDSVQD